MNKSIFTPYQLFLMILMIFAFACDSDDEGDGPPPPPTTEEMLLGTWTSTNTDITLTIDDKSLNDYLVEDLGWTQEEADIFVDIFESELESSLEGSLTFNDDGTFDSNFDDSPDDGTWSLSADDTTITLDEGTSDEVEITILSITDSTLMVSIEDSSFEDLDDDPETPDVEIVILGEITLTK